MKQYIIKDLFGDEIHYYADSIKEAEEVIPKLPKGIYQIIPIYVNEE